MSQSLLVEPRPLPLTRPPAKGEARKKKGLPAEGVVRATYDLPRFLFTKP